MLLQARHIGIVINHTAPVDRDILAAVMCPRLFAPIPERLGFDVDSFTVNLWSPSGRVQRSITWPAHRLAVQVSASSASAADKAMADGCAGCPGKPKRSAREGCLSRADFLLMARPRKAYLFGLVLHAYGTTTGQLGAVAPLLSAQLMRP